MTTLFPPPPVQATPVIQPIAPGTEKPDFSKNVLTREWEQHFQIISEQFNANAATLTDHGTRITALENKFNAYFHIGFIFETTNSANPATYLGLGTWALHGVGRVTICLDSADTDFDTIGETGGSKTSTISAHKHTLSAHTHDMNDHTHEVTVSLAAGANIAAGSDYNASATVDTGVPDPAVTLGPSVDETGSSGGTTADTMSPYIVVYRWRRTA